MAGCWAVKRVHFLLTAEKTMWSQMKAGQSFGKTAGLMAVCLAELVVK